MAALRRRARPAIPCDWPCGWHFRGPRDRLLGSPRSPPWVAPWDGPLAWRQGPPKTPPQGLQGNLGDWLIGERPGRGHEPEPVALCHPHWAGLTRTRARLRPQGPRTWDLK